MSISKSELRKVTLAASIGTFLEYYDLLLSATAAGIVWPSLYFSPATKNPTIGLALSLSTVGIAFIVRPLGGLIFGQIGDKLGRKSTLIITLLLMFIGTFGLGVLPTYAQIGVLSAFMIIILRIIQGIGFGGEWGGAVSWIVEFAKKANISPTYWTSFLQGAVLFGISASTFGFAIVSALLDRASFLSWGWRLLFIVGAIIVVLGALMRYYTSESPLFLELKVKGELSKSPALETLKKYWVSIILLAIAWWYMTVTTVLIATPYSIQFASAIGVNTILGLSSQSFMNLVIGIGYVVGGLASIVLGVMTKSIRMTRLNVVVAVLCSVLVYLYFYMISLKEAYFVILSSAIFYGAVFYPFGGLASWFAESFPTKYRYTGTGLAYQIGGLLSGIVSTFVPPIILLYTKLPVSQLWLYYAFTYTIICIISALATIAYSRVHGKIEMPK
ncbi:hypothetical protein SUSAZ_08230 [Sulfolobus acidocaldarius SUSAZ]|nr:hypothetical protein SUSAZ_08230 [Sulfolobus acidocaldarius SUSAZ]